MANSSQANKRIRQANKSRGRNREWRSQYRTAIKKLHLALSNKEGVDVVTVCYRKVTSILDRLAIKGIVHVNKASRLKSRLYKLMQKQYSEYSEQK